MLLEANLPKIVSLVLSIFDFVRVFIENNIERFQRECPHYRKKKLTFFFLYVYAGGLAKAVWNKTFTPTAPKKTAKV